jgi:hypothetical protein
LINSSGYITIIIAPLYRLYAFWAMPAKLIPARLRHVRVNARGNIKEQPGMVHIAVRDIYVIEICVDKRKMLAHAA